MYHYLAPHDAPLSPWSEIYCDTIGPWTVDLRARATAFKVMTIIDPVSNLLELIPLVTKTTAEETAANLGIPGL